MTKNFSILQRNILLLMICAIAGCGNSGSEDNGASDLRKVSVYTVKAEPSSVASEFPGRVVPVRIAEVRARTAGVVIKKDFVEGAEVKAGDLLFEIDPAPLKTAVAHAQAELARSLAALTEAQQTVARYAPLVKVEAISVQDFDSATAALSAAQAGSKSAAADLETAKLNLGYASVRSPINGRIGKALVTEGALVGQNEATLMARVQQLDPVYVDFTQPVSDLVKLQEKSPSGQLATGQLSLTIRPEGSEIERPGLLEFSDITVDPTTSQVSLRGSFANSDFVLLPGMYVRVRVTNDGESNAIFVPQRAVSRDTSGSAFVMVLGEDNVVEARAVDVGGMQGARWEIRNGLSEGERVITGGLTGLEAGVKVEVKNSPAVQSASR